MTNVLDRELVDAPAELSPARTQADGPAESTPEGFRDLVVSPGSTWRADKALLERMQQESLDGPRFQALLNDLTAYALPVMESLIRSGRIFLETRKHGRPVIKPDWFSPEDAEELVAETVVEGIKLFREQIMRGSWDPGEKTSLGTYLVGACVRSFPNVFRRFERSHTRWRTHSIAVDAVEYDHFLNARTARSAEDTVLARQSLWSAIADLSHAKQQLVFFIVSEMPQDEIAKKLGISTRAVEGRVRRTREELREILESGSRRWMISTGGAEQFCSVSRWKDALSEL